jgi:hypothetical protein
LDGTTGAAQRHEHRERDRCSQSSGIQLIRHGFRPRAQPTPTFGRREEVGSQQRALRLKIDDNEPDARDHWGASGQVGFQEV